MYLQYIGIVFLLKITKSLHFGIGIGIGTGIVFGESTSNSYNLSDRLYILHKIEYFLQQNILLFGVNQS